MKKSERTLAIVLSIIGLGIIGAFVWTFYSVGYLDFGEQSSNEPPMRAVPIPASPKATNSAQAATTIYYLAVNSDTPVPKDPVPVADQSTMQLLVAAAQDKNREKYNSIAESSNVILVPGGAIVDITSTVDNLVQVRLHGRDMNGNDLSGQTGWTSSKFVQSRKF